MCSLHKMYSQGGEPCDPVYLLRRSFLVLLSLFYCHYTLIEVPVSHSLNLQFGFLWVGGWISALLFSWLTSYFWLFILQERRSKLPGCDSRFARIRTFLCLKFGSVFAERTWDQSATIPGSDSSTGI